MRLFKFLINKIVYGERATSDSFVTKLKRECLHFGDNNYFVNSHNSFVDNGARFLIWIGDNVQFGSGTTILAHDESYSICGLVYEDYPKKTKITRIGSNVFLGWGVTVLMGASIGDNVIVGAKSVVVGKLNSNSVYAGNPAKFIMSLEDYHSRHRESFEKSAYFYIRSFQLSKRRQPRVEELHMFQVLFSDAPALKPAINKPISVIQQVNANAAKLRKYNSIEVFLQSNHSFESDFQSAIGESTSFKNDQKQNDN